MKNKLTLIVTSYNNGLYIKECLDSIFRQTFKNINVLVIDDKSSDNSVDIIKNFITDKSNFKLIQLETNSGSASAPRNKGLELADSEYVMFIDGDDWLPEDAIEKLFFSIEHHDSDFVCGQVIRSNNHEIWFKDKIYGKEKINFDLRELPNLIYCGLSVNKIYKKSFLDENNLRFLDGYLYEDILFMTQCYLVAKKISIIDTPVYFWRVVTETNNKSVTNQRFIPKNFLHRIKIHKMIDEELVKNKDYILVSKKNERFLRHDFLLYLRDYIDYDDSYRQIFKEEMHTYLKESFKKSEFLPIPDFQRIAAYLLYVGDFIVFDEFIKYYHKMQTSFNILSFKDSYFYIHSDLIENEEHFYLNTKKIHPVCNLLDTKINDNHFKFKSDFSVVGLPNLTNCSFSFSFFNVKKKSSLTINSEKDIHTFNLHDFNNGSYILKCNFNIFGEDKSFFVKSHALNNFQQEKIISKGKIFKTFFSENNNFGFRINNEIEKTQYVKKLIKLVLKTNKKKKKKLSTSNNSLTSVDFNNTFVFESHMGKQYSDNPRYIFEELYQRFPQLTFVWSFENPEKFDLPKNVIKVKRKSSAHLFYLKNAKFWIDNQGLGHLTEKKPSQIYLQTFHGTPVKKMGIDQDKISPDAINSLKKHSNSWDAFITPNDYSAEIFKRSFMLESEILNFGYPRNDILVNNKDNFELKNSLKETLNVDKNKKTILYAPTFRDFNNKYIEQLASNITKIAKELSNDYTLLVRLHYLNSKELKKFIIPSNVIDVSEYNDINDLYLASDVLITDYSSVMFDYANLNRPIILFCEDIFEYNFRRGLYFDFKKENPGYYTEDVDTLISILKSSPKINEDFYNFRKKFCHLEEGISSKKAVDWLLSKK